MVPATAAMQNQKLLLDEYLKDNNMDDVLDSIKQQGTYNGNFMHLAIQNQMLVFITIRKCSKKLYR